MDPQPQQPPLAAASLVLGILAMLANTTWAGSCCCAPFGWLGGVLVLVLGLCAVILGFVARGQAKATGAPLGLATMGIVTGVASLVVDAVLFIALTGMAIVAIALNLIAGN